MNYSKCVSVLCIMFVQGYIGGSLGISPVSCFPLSIFHFQILLCNNIIKLGAIDYWETMYNFTNYLDRDYDFFFKKFNYFIKFYRDKLKTLPKSSCIERQSCDNKILAFFLPWPKFLYEMLLCKAWFTMMLAP